MKTRFLPVLLASVLLAIPLPGLAQEEEPDWLEYYYLHPAPERFVEQMKDWAEDGTLDNDHAKPALIAFLSQVIRQNPGEIAAWYEQLAGLDPARMQVLHTAMLFSRTGEADALMREKFGQAYDEQKSEMKKILELPLDKEGTADMLWGFFYATGSEGAIRRIVTCFRFKDAPDRPEGVNVPDGYVPLYKSLPSFAFRSLTDNASRHPRVIEILRELLAEDETLIDVEKEAIREVLAEVSPAA